MEATAPTARVLRFGIFELDEQSGELRRHGLKIRLADQPFQILRLLLDRPGAVVTREELRQRLWTSDTSVDFDVGLNSAIRKLRGALDDSAENPRFIETLPRRGYRFIASVTSATVDDPPNLVTNRAAESGSGIRRDWIAGGLLLAVATLAIALIYQSKWWEPISAGAAAAPIRSVAVLPFENLTGDPTRDYFSDAMTDLLTTQLVQAGGFDVISLTSAMQYEGTKKSLTEIGQELDVDGLVAGAIVRSGQHVRITVRLIRAATDRHVWARSYEVGLRDAVGLEREMGRAITTAITGQPVSPPPVPAGAPRAVSPQAYDAYLKAMATAGRLTPDGMRTALAYLGDAVARQPDFAAAHAAMAHIQFQSLYTGPLSPREVIAKAEPSARKAIELDDALPQPHRTLGTILRNFYWRWEEGDKELRRAQELSGNAGEARRAEMLRTGHFEEAIAAAERTLRLDPLSFGAHVDVAMVHRAAGEYDRAIAGIRRALEVFPGQARGHFQLGVTFIFMGRTTEAIGELETAVRSSKGNPRFQAYLGYAYAAAGRPADARRILNELESRARQQYVSSFGMALIYDALGEKEPALAALERAYQDRAVEFAQMNQYPPFKTIASEARFQAVMRQVGLPR
jgi:TolB-like protein/DNA-binding winged helix-turn-helix (wHTH) protein/tetratricopeptide (TPR) repeat protein